MGKRPTFGATAHKLVAVARKLGGHFEELGDLVGHGYEICVE